MFPVGKADLFCKENTGFSINSVQKTAAAIVSDFGRDIFHYDGGLRLRRYDDDDGGSGELWSWTS